MHNPVQPQTFTQTMDHVRIDYVRFSLARLRIRNVPRLARPLFASDSVVVYMTVYVIHVYALKLI